MEVVYTHCCGLDVHKRTVVACIIVPGPGGTPRRETLAFGTMTSEIRRLGEWLAANGVTHVAMEATGSYWKPIWNILESAFNLVLANARDVKTVPGRKSDVKDCQWIADLFRHGLIRGSFVPNREQRELRELTGYRTRLIEERSAEVNRLQKILEGANIKLASVATDVMGASGRRILAALVAGTADPVTMAALAKGRLRAKIPQLAEALRGSFGAHQRLIIAHQLAHIDFLDETIEQLDQEVANRLRPFEEIIVRLDAVTGLGRRAIEIILAQIGTDMSRFPTDKHIAAWAGMVPGSNESGGKRKSARTRKGNSALRSILVQAAHAAGHSKNTYLGAQFRRLAARRGKKRAAVAVGHSILVITYNMIKHGTTYSDLGGNYFDLRDRQALERRLVNRLKALGYEVTLEPRQEAA